VAHQVFRLYGAQGFANLGSQVAAFDLGTKADAALLRALANHLFQTGKRTATDKQDIGGVDLQKLLLGMLAPALGGYGCHGALDQFEQCLLDALPGHIPGDGGVVRLAGDFVDLIDVDNAPLGLFHIVVALLQQLLDDVFNILTHIAGLGQGGGVGNGEGHVEQPREGLGEQGLAAVGGADQEAIAVAQLDIRFTGGALKALVVVVRRHRQHFLGPLLADHLLVEDVLDLFRGGQLVAATAADVLLNFFRDDVVAQIDTLVTDKHRRASNQLAHLVLTFAAEGAVKQLAIVVGFALTAHRFTSKKTI